MDFEEEAIQPQRGQSTVAESLIAQQELDQPSTCPESRPDSSEPDSTDSKQTLNQSEIFKALKVVERDSLAIAESFTGLFASLRLALSEVTTNSTDHMQCFGDAAGRLQESVLDAATKGNRYTNSCLRNSLQYINEAPSLISNSQWQLRLNEEMKGIDTLAGQLKILRRNVDALDTAVNRLIRLP